MRGIVTIDRQPDSTRWTVWVSSSFAGRVQHVNAVVIEADSDPDAVEKVRSLTRRSAVLVTEGTSLEGLPIVGAPLTVKDIDALLDEVDEWQVAILAAVAEYRRRKGSKLVDPEFPLRPQALDGESPGTSWGRAFDLANYAVRAWSAWAATEAERVVRTVQPRTGVTPWIMPAELNAPSAASLPPRFLGAVIEQDMV